MNSLNFFVLLVATKQIYCNLLLEEIFGTATQLPNLIYLNIDRTTFPSWYCSNPQLNFQVEKFLNFSQYTTICADLSADFPITLCQKANLSIGSKYSISYSVFSTVLYQNMNAKAYINGILLCNLLIPNPSSFANITYSFYANSFSNQFCFNQTHQVAPSKQGLTGIGGCLDNVSLILIEKQPVMFQSSLHQKQKLIIISGNITYNQLFVNHLKNRYYISIQGRLVDYIVGKSIDGYIQFNISANFTLSLRSIKFVLKVNETQIWNETKLDPYFRQTNEYLILVNQNVGIVLNNTKQVFKVTSLVFDKLSSLSKIFFCSYFINMIIDLEFLSLFYVFPLASAIPKFTKNIYYEVFTLIFSSEGIVESFQNFFNITSSSLQPNFENQFSQKIDTFRNEEPWLGFYGLSSRVIQNNLSNIVSLCWLIVKYGLLTLFIKLILMCFPSLKEKIQLKTSLLTLLLTEFCFMMPNFLISVMSNILSPVTNFREKFYKFGNVLVLFLCMICIFVFIFLPSFGKKVKGLQENKKKKKVSKTSKRSKKVRTGNKQKRKVKNYKNIKKAKERIQFSAQAFNAPFLFFIPVMASIGNPQMFLLITSIIIAFRLISFLICNHKDQWLVQKIIEFLIGLVWLIHHISFVLLFIYSSENLTLSQIQFVSNLGLMVIFTVLAIMILQTLKLIVSVIKFTSETINEIYQYCKKNQIKQQQIQEQNKDQDQDKDNKNYVNVIKIRSQKQINMKERQLLTVQIFDNSQNQNQNQDKQQQITNQDQSVLSIKKYIQKDPSIKIQ